MAARVEGAPDVSMASLLDPFARRLDRAEVVTLLLPEPLASLDAHRLAYKGKPLLASVPVRYAVDVAGPTVVTAAGPSLRALVVSDPRRDLSLARVGSGIVVDTLSGQGFRVHQRVGRRATRRAVLDQLGTADWLHYSGHGRPGPVWESRLVLADGEISVSDVLALQRTPRVAVINACSMAEEPDGGIAMASAMVVSGTERALAPTTAVSDRTAEALSQRLYAELSQGRSMSLAYATAVRSIAGTALDHEAWNYRLIRN